jgi:hypothetical protein
MFDQNVLAMFGIIASMFVLYLLIWLFWLRLQVKSIGTPVYRGTPPDRFSPASARYLFKKEYDNVAFVCAIASAGTKGYLSAKCLGKKVSVSKEYRSTSSDLWTVSRQDDYRKKDLTEDEDVALSSLFGYEETVEVSQENQKLLPKCLTAHEDHLKKELDTSFINFHPKLEIMATIMYLICVSGMAWVIRGANFVEGFCKELVYQHRLNIAKRVHMNVSEVSAGFENLADMFNCWTMELSFLGFSVILILGLVGVEIFFSFLSIGMSWFTPQSSFSDMLKFGGEEFLRTVFFILIGTVLCSMIWIFLGPELIFFFLILRGLNRWFFAKTNQYTLQGRRIMDQLEDFRDYLLQHGPKDISSVPRTSVYSTFTEKWRPYAIALDIEQDWVEIAGNNSSTSTWFEVENLSGVFPIGTSLSNCLTAASPFKKGKSSVQHGGGGGGDGGGE